MSVSTANSGRQSDLSQNHTVLVIEDTDSSAHQYRQLLQEARGSSYRALAAPLNEAVLDFCQAQSVDVILFEMLLADASAFDRLYTRLQLTAETPLPPVIVVGLDNANLAVRSLKAGAADYLVKNQLTSAQLQQAIEAAINSGTSQRVLVDAPATPNVSIEHQAISDLSATEPSNPTAALLQAMMENLPGGAVFLVDRDLRYLLAEGEALAAAGFEPEDFVGRTIFEVLPPELATSYEPLYRQALTGEAFEVEHNAHDHTYISRGTPLWDERGEIYAVLVVSYDITDRKRIEDERKQAEAAATADLENTQRLHELSTRLIVEDNIQTLYQEIVATAIALTCADAGTVQILDEATQDLLLLATQGFERKMTDHFYRVNARSNTPCGIALATGDRTWVDFDVPESEDPDNSMRMHREAGYLSAQSTPLITRSGKAIGMFSTHWRKHHRASDRELRLLDLLARQAADLIEQRQATEALRESRTELARELEDTKQLQQISSLLIDGEDGEGLYEQVLEAAMAIMRADFGSIQMLDAERGELHLLAWRNFHPESAAFWQTVSVEMGTSCGAALNHGERVIVPDVRTADSIQNPETQRHYRLSGIAAVQSTPLTTREGQVVGMISTHWRNVHTPDERELRSLDILARQAADFFERRHAQNVLRESEEKYRSLFNSIDEGFCLFEMIYDETGKTVDYRFLEVNRVFEQQTGLENVVGRLGSEVAPNTERYWFEAYDDVVKTGNPQRIENYNQATDRWYAAYASRVGHEGSRQVCTVFSDISDRKRNEQRQTYLLQLSDALRSLSDAVEIHATVTHIAMNFFGADRCYYCEIIDGNAIIRRDASRVDLPSVAGVYHLSDFPIFKAVIDSGHPFVVEDAHTTNMLDESLRQLCCELQVISFINVPVIKEGKPTGVLCITQTTPRNWTALETELAQETAERVWAAVERACAEVALRESEIERVREQAALEQERQRAETLVELDRVKTQFFSNISHEFRTPLTLLLGPLADALKSIEEWEGENENASTHPPSYLPILRFHLHLAHRNALRLLKLVNTLLDFSRVEAERLQITYAPTDLAAYTADLASVFRSTVESTGLTFTVDCPPLPEPVYIDRDMWEKIVLNLLSNAFKFTFEGEIRVRLRVEAAHPNWAVLEVQDTGIGIPADELPHIFERFYQSKGNQGRSYEGSGIGLSLVQELVRLHQGTVEARSEVGHGTTFTVRVPAGTPPLPAGGQTHHASQPVVEASAVQTRAFVEEAQSWLSQQDLSLAIAGAPSAQNSPDSAFTAPDSQPDGFKPRILLVEDNADMQGYLERLLAPSYHVETADDGLAALTMIRDASAQDEAGSPRYDLILTDVMMPKLDGFELLRMLRDDPNTREIPVILLSARAGEESQIEGLEAGADDYLVKPFSARQLLARVQTHLQLARMRREAVYREQVMREVQALNTMLEQQVQARTAQIKTTNQELEAFSYSVSHDLQTPLRYISSFVERLQARMNTDQADASSLRYLSIIEQAAGQAHKMINDLLEFSRMGKTQLHLTQVSMDELVQQVRSQLEPETADRIILWQIEPLPEVQGDPELLRLVLQNLLSNAVKYTRDQATATITIGSITHDQEMVFFVQDNGAGFDMNYCDRLFGLFQRLHSQEQFAGTGVGLANVRRIIHRHGGRVWAEGAVDQGATFYFSLPTQEVGT